MDKIKESLTQERLKELVHYDSEKGIFTRKVSTSNRIKVGDIVGFIHKFGYVKASIDSRTYFCHRLAWLYVYGEFPKNTIDHIDHDRANNRIDNLREVSNRENQRNLSMNSLNTSGFNGVYWKKCRRKWESRIEVNGKNIHLGYYNIFDDAVSARKSANIEHKFHINHGCSKGVIESKHNPKVSK